MGCDGSITTITGSCTGAVPFVECCTEATPDVPTPIVYFEVDFDVDDPDIMMAMMLGLPPPFRTVRSEFGGGVVPDMGPPLIPPTPTSTNDVLPDDPPPPPPPPPPPRETTVTVNVN